MGAKETAEISRYTSMVSVSGINSTPSKDTATSKGPKLLSLGGLQMMVEASRTRPGQDLGAKPDSTFLVVKRTMTCSEG